MPESQANFDMVQAIEIGDFQDFCIIRCEFDNFGYTIRVVGNARGVMSIAHLSIIIAVLSTAAWFQLTRLLNLIPEMPYLLRIAF